MYCDECPDRTRCDERESFIVGDQFELCEETGKPDWRPDGYFYDTLGCIAEPDAENTEKEAEKDMNKKGTCSNCKRGDLTLVGDLCHTCYNAANGKTDEERFGALQAVAARIKGGNIRPSWKKAGQTAGKMTETPPDRTRLEEGSKSGSITLELDSYPEIKQAIEQEAGKEFRSVEMQILYILNRHVGLGA